MAKTNSQIRQQSLASLKGRWGAAILLPVIYIVIVSILGFIPVVNFVAFLVSIPLSYGLSVWFLKFIRMDRDQTPDVQLLFDGFKDYIRIFLSMFLVALYTILWSLLLVVPGIIKGLSYSMTPYILNDNPELKNNAAIELSSAMMRGNKMKLFLMNLNFLLWCLLSVVTLGIGMLWVYPYMQATMASFYEDVKADFCARLI